VTLRLWVDGCCLVNPDGPGGWAAIVEDKGSGRVLSTVSGGEHSTTNNRMELTAAIEGIEHAAANHSEFAPEVWSDSKYVVEGANSWRWKWKQNGWRKKPGAKEQVANVDLWMALDEIAGNVIRFVWVKGHDGNRLNEQADELALRAATSEVTDPEIALVYEEIDAAEGAAA